MFSPPIGLECFCISFLLLKDTVRMGSTLEQHRAVIGRFAARQISHSWSPSSAATISRRSKMTEKKRRKPQVAKADWTCVGRGIQLILLFSLFTTACPAGQSIAGYTFSDQGSFHTTAGYGNSEDLNTTTFQFNSWSHQLAELPTMSTKLTHAAVVAIASNPGYQASFNLLTPN